MCESVAAGIDELLAVDPDGLTDGELHELVVHTHRESYRLAAARARLVAAWDARRCWAADGSRSAGHRLAREAAMSVRTAKTEVRRAAALRTMPHTVAALGAGAISPEHVDLLARANSGKRRVVFEEHEEFLVEQCTVLRFADADRALEYWKQRADAATIEADAERHHEGRSATAATTIDGMVDLRALLDPVGGAEFLDELGRLCERLRLDDLRTGRVRTGCQRRTDALVEMARRSRTAREGGLRPRPLITVLVGESTLAHICELATGTVIAPGRVVPLLSEADLERVVFDGPDRVISVSRKRRFTGALRRAIETRDRSCQHPSGCDEPASRCDVDHRIPWSAGGMTGQENGELRCWPHNRIEDVRNARPPENDDHQDRAPPDADAA